MLECVSQAELKRPLEVLIGHFPECRTVRIGVRTVPVWMVRDVVHLSAERHALLLSQPERLEQRACPVLEAWTVQEVAVALCGEGSRRRLLERARIEVRVRIGSGPCCRESGTRGVRIAHDVVNTGGHIIVAIA